MALRGGLRRFLAAAPALVLLTYGLAIGPRYDRFVLPAFDGHVYDAMADTPRVFTLVPWGYRILAPSIVHVLGAPSMAEGYYWLNIFCLTGSVFLVGVWLRRLGFGEVAAALAGFAFVASPPVAEFLSYQVLVSPLGLLILCLMLLELTAPRTLVMAALFAAGALTREECLIPLALLFAVLSEQKGLRSAVLTTLIAATPALVLALGLRATWGFGQTEVAASLLQTLPERIEKSGGLLIRSAAMSGVGILALVGLRRESSLSLRVQAFLLWFLTFVAVVANPYQFSAADLPRLSASAWPPVLPLALAGLGFKRRPAPSRGARFPWAANVAAILTLLACTGLVLSVDPYRRVPRWAHADAIPFLARNRETLKTARRLEAGEAFVFDARSGRFAPPVTETINLTEGRRFRWFLFTGFPREATFEGAPEFQGEAELLLPILNPRDASLLVELEGGGEEEAEVRLEVAGHAIGTVRVNGRPAKLTAPRASLFRGDNLVHLSGPAGVPIRLVRFEAHL